MGTPHGVQSADREDHVGRQSPTNDQVPLKVGVIGCGFIAERAHLPAFSALPTARVVAVADCNLARAERIARRFRVPAIYADPLELLETEHPVILDICTPSQTHAELALAAIDHGAHVLLEKPMVLSTADADLLLEAAALRNVRVGVVHNNLFSDALQRLQALVGGGHLGQLVSVRTVWTNRLPFEWKADWAEDDPRVFFFEYTVHCFYLTLAFLNKPSLLYACGRACDGLPRLPVGFHFLRVSFGGHGAHGEIVILWGAKGGNTFTVEILGTKGRAVADVFRNTLLHNSAGGAETVSLIRATAADAAKALVGLGLSTMRRAFNRAHSHKRLIREFANSLTQGTPLPVEGVEGREVIAVMDNVLSALERRSS